MMLDVVELAADALAGEFFGEERGERLAFLPVPQAIEHEADARGWSTIWLGCLHVVKCSAAAARSSRMTIVAFFGTTTTPALSLSPFRPMLQGSSFLHKSIPTIGWPALPKQ